MTRGYTRRSQEKSATPLAGWHHASLARPPQIPLLCTPFQPRVERRPVPIPNPGEVLLPVEGEGGAVLAACHPPFVASHEESATTGCFFDPQEMVADMYWNVHPDVECFTAQSESVMPNILRSFFACDERTVNMRREICRIDWRWRSLYPSMEIARRACAKAAKHEKKRERRKI